jgi:hypothetical protein
MRRRRSRAPQQQGPIRRAGDSRWILCHPIRTPHSGLRLCMKPNRRSLAGGRSARRGSARRVRRRSVDTRGRRRPSRGGSPTTREIRAADRAPRRRRQFDARHDPGKSAPRALRAHLTGHVRYTWPLCAHASDERKVEDVRRASRREGVAGRHRRRRARRRRGPRAVAPIGFVVTRRWGREANAKRKLTVRP